MSLQHVVRLLVNDTVVADDSHDQDGHTEEPPESHDGDELADESTNRDAAIAFAIVLIAGLSTCVGASAVFFPQVVSLASPRVLACALGFSAGVMLFLCFAEIFPVAIDHFEASGHNYEDAFTFAVLAFFGGIFIMQIFNYVVHSLNPGSHGHTHECTQGEFVEYCQEDVCNEPALTAPHCISCTDNPLGELSEWQERAKQEVEHQHQRDGNDVDRKIHQKTDQATENTSFVAECCEDNPSACDNNSKNIDMCTLGNMDEEEGERGDTTNNKDDFQENTPPNGDHIHDESGHSHDHSHHSLSYDNNENDGSCDHDHTHVHEKKGVMNAGVSVAVAIAIHNFPEGFATFIAGIDDPRIGGVLAFAIAIHNIPEGLCVALPIYYGTGDRLKGFLWGAFSGLSEPVAALMAWGILNRSEFNNDVYGVLFGLVTGMMIFISVKELLPTAHRYDPLDTVVTNSLIAGFVIIALSLLLFERTSGHMHASDYHGGHGHASDDHASDDHASDDHASDDHPSGSQRWF